MILEFTASILQPLPLAKVLRHHEQISLTLWRKIKRNGQVLCNGKPITAQDFVKPGDHLLVEWVEQSHLPATKLPLSILYEDDCLLAVNKSAGQLVHPTTAWEKNTLANAILYYYQETGQLLNYHPVYRLDRNTSGVLLVAKSPYWQQFLSSHVNLQRIYWGFIQGVLNKPSGIIDLPIGRKPGSIIEREVRSDGAPAVTCYETLNSGHNISLIKLLLHTGRTHQIRVHLSALGHPLLGDDLYGGTCELISRQALHALCIQFKHPQTQKVLSIEAKIPQDLEILQKRIKG